LFTSGFIINAITDVNVDKKYKTFVSNSIDIIGVKNAKKILIIQVVIALLLTTHICFLVNNFWLFLWVVAGTFFGLAYSIKPFHFKVRGILHATLVFSSGIAPLVFLYYVIGGIPSTSIIFVILFFVILHYGIALVNQTQDYLEDKDSGLLTPAVRWGITRTLKIALILSLTGLFLGFIGFYILFMDLPSLSIFGYNLSFGFLYTITVITLLVAYYTPINGIRDLIKISSNGDTIETKMTWIKKRINYPRWQASGIIGFTVVSFIFFSVKIF
jgi:4-hydroxybenzoate polyprenyltransferase